MKNARFRRPSPDAQDVLVHGKVLVVPAERNQEFDDLIANNHYLKSSNLVGEHIR